MLPFASEVIRSYNSNWITLLLLYTSAPLVLCCDRLNCGSRQVMHDPVYLVTVDYCITLRWRIEVFDATCILVLYAFTAEGL